VLLGIKRIYEKASITDGKRIFVDRLWPRGVKKSTANIDMWLKDVAPSNELRKWFAHDPNKWVEFESRYTKELERNPAVQQLIDMVKSSDITLLYSTEDKEHNNAVVLADFIKKSI
jgi:uncharacterized protein YeaO (DUF488 family)